MRLEICTSIIFKLKFEKKNNKISLCVCMDEVFTLLFF